MGRGWKRTGEAGRHRASPLPDSAGSATPRTCASAWVWGPSTSARRRSGIVWGLLNALAIALLTVLGAAGEALGYDRYLKSNTTQRRTHSLFRQGCMLYELIPTMPELRLPPPVKRLAAMLAGMPVFADAFGVM